MFYNYLFSRHFSPQVHSEIIAKQSKVLVLNNILSFLKWNFNFFPLCFKLSLHLLYVCLLSVSLKVFKFMHLESWQNIKKSYLTVTKCHATSHNSIKIHSWIVVKAIIYTPNEHFKILCFVFFVLVQVGSSVQWRPVHQRVPAAV